MELTFPIDPTAPEPSSPRRDEQPRRRGAQDRPSRKRKSTAGGGGTGEGPRPPRKAPPREEDHDFPAGVRWSLVAHGAFLIFLIVKGLLWPVETTVLLPTLRVDVVGLPDFLKNDLKDVPQTSPGMASALKEADEAARQELSRQQETEKAREEAAEEADPDELVLQAKRRQQADERNKREKARAEAEQKQRRVREESARRDRERRAQNALARIRALSKLQSDSRDDSNANEPGTGVVIRGNQVSGGTSLDSNARQGMESSYFERIRNRLVDNWALPVWLTRQNLQAQVLIFIDRRGRLRDFRFTRNSGNPSFDEAVRKTLRDSQPFPLPPQEISDSIDSNGILVGFPL